jgi:hypothetical protein
MNARIRTITLLLMLFCGLVVQFTGSNTTYALIPSDNHRQRYIEPNGSYTYWISDKEGYVKSTLPNEWFVSWSNESLQAGAVIIRSGVFWRVNRSVLGSSAPNNNCYKGGSGSTLYYRTVPNTRGGEEEWIPYSGQTKTNTATDNTANYHAERVNLPSGRPDKLVGLRYNSTIQNRTESTTGGWLARVRYAYVGAGSPGSPFDPNLECSQEDDQTNSDPTYPNT